jgi:hypothetical protein
MPTPDPQVPGGPVDTARLLRYVTTLRHLTEVAEFAAEDLARGTKTEVRQGLLRAAGWVLQTEAAMEVDASWRRSARLNLIRIHLDEVRAIAHAFFGTTRDPSPAELRRLRSLLRSLEDIRKRLTAPPATPDSVRTSRNPDRDLYIVEARTKRVPVKEVLAEIERRGWKPLTESGVRSVLLRAGRTLHIQTPPFRRYLRRQPYLTRSEAFPAVEFTSEVRKGPHSEPVENLLPRAKRSG